ncbi:MAG: hypothetical protein R3B81_15410 [bacterium]
MSPTRALVIACSAVSIATAGCGGPSGRDVRLTVLDPAGHPVPGAAVYVEARTDHGPVGGYLAIAGEAGEVPDAAREAARVPWARGARAAVVAFAPGRRPAVAWSEQGSVRTDGAVLTLAPADSSIAAPEHLARFSWPPPAGLPGVDPAGPAYDRVDAGFRAAAAAAPGAEPRAGDRPRSGAD